MRRCVRFISIFCLMTMCVRTEIIRLKVEQGLWKCEGKVGFNNSKNIDGLVDRLYSWINNLHIFTFINNKFRSIFS